MGQMTASRDFVPSGKRDRPNGKGPEIEETKVDGLVKSPKRTFYEVIKVEKGIASMEKKKRKSKVVTLKEAAVLVKNGDKVSIGGLHGHNGPMALIREIIRHHPKNLHVVGNVSCGIPIDIIIGAGFASEVTCCYIGLEHFGLAPNFRKMAEEKKILVHDGEEPYLVLGLLAGATSLPFVPYPHGSDLVDTMSVNPNYKKTLDPYTNKEVTTIPPIIPDVGILHVPACDEYGNAQIHGSVFQDDLIAKASKKVIVTTEEIIPNEIVRKDPKRTAIPGYLVDLVVEVPFGAHPTSCHGCYGYDGEHIVYYRDTPIEQYLEEFVFSLESHQAYLEKIGSKKLEQLKRD
ncbi:CoA transferase subunit A [Thermodesulfobacteriota bacterium]